MPYSAKPQSIIEIDTRLSELEEEKNRLLALREHLQQPSPNSADSIYYTPEQKIAIFRGLFRGRTDIFANRWQNTQGRSGYSVACNNEWVQGICIKCQDCNHRQFTELNDQVIYNHLAGQQVSGLYTLMHDNTCYFLAADFDKGQWQEEVKAISKACHNFEIPHAIEISRSGNGAHLWIFFNEKVPAKEARLLGFGLLDKAMEFYPNLSFDSYDRLFPNQDILPEGGFGNLIALPLQKEARLLDNSSFIEQGYLAIPRGCLDEALELLTENQVEAQINDKRESGTKLKTIKSLVKLRKNQQSAVRAMPIAWKDSLAQYAGRIHRESDGKASVTIHDCVDCSLPMLQRMFKKREKSYKAMGYKTEFADSASPHDIKSNGHLLAPDKMDSKAPA